ncbi:hypothetical protein PANO111632_09310 [Paracoccus nototheniae]|uniref:Uncharacterized protein n=1 Tax=Paracoccus nototheniae TaxID=2489002 RepID=A0ABW4DZP3_9RHOB|nr:hypothetical protein [Paracoccus nototheniae]
MIGVVVWSSGPREKAIIWCEDQSTLAYLQGRANVADPLKWPQAGDLVELETRTVGDLRHALSVSILSEQAASHLPQILSRFDPEQRAPQLRVVANQGRLTAEGAIAPTPCCSGPDYAAARNRATR